MQLLRPALLALALCSTVIMADDGPLPLKAQNTKDVATDGLSADAGASISGEFAPFEGFGIGCGVNANATEGILGGGLNAGAKSMMYELGGGFTIRERNATLGIGAVFNGTVGNTDIKIEHKKVTFTLTAGGPITCGSPYPATNGSFATVCTFTSA